MAIGRLERFVADWHNDHSKDPPNGLLPWPQGWLLGSGPSGLTCAGDLAKLGYDVTVFEALHTAGGVLVYGIPEFRLPKAIVQKEIGYAQGAGRQGGNQYGHRQSALCGRTAGGRVQAVFIGSGAGLPRFMNIPGENLKGVYSANEFLTRVNLMKSYQDNSDTPIQHAKRLRWWEAATWPWTRPAAPKGWARRKFPSCTGVQRERTARPCRGGGACEGGRHRLPASAQPH